MSFHFPQSFYLLAPAFLMVLLHAWTRWRRRRDIQNLGDWRLVQQMVPVVALRRRGKKELAALAALFILIFAAAGPQFGTHLKEVKHRGVDVFIAVDTSRSMLAEDIPPSRLEKAKQSLSLLIHKLQGNRVGIIAFAKFAVIQCPPTVDTEAARMFLDIMDTNTVPKQGTAIGEAIRLALQSFNKDDKAGKAIVLLTDGEDHQSDPTGAAKMAQEKGVVIFTIGIGTTKGEVIKNRDEQGKVIEFFKHNGEMVLSRMDDALLSKIAAQTGGKYYRSSSTDKEIDEIADILNGFDKKEFSTRMYQRLEERYQWFAALALLLLILEFFIAEKPGQWARINPQNHRNFEIPSTVKLALLIGLILIPSWGWADLKEHVRHGNDLLRKKDFVGARGEFESALIDAPEAAFLPYNIATTYYLEGNFEEAKKNYEKALAMAASPDLKSKCAYNLGHVTFHMGDRPGAIEKFKDCLRLDPRDADAKYNIEYIRAGKTPKNPMKPKDNKGQQGEKNQQQNQNQENKNGQQKKDGDLSQEDTERVLQMIKDEEKEKQKEALQIKRNQERPKDEKETPYEDW